MTMQRYVCHKVVNATPMTRQAYNDLRGWTLPSDENGADEGFLVEYLDGGQSNHPLYTGYISWSPKDVFERGYRLVVHAPTGLSFGEAIDALKQGFRVSRSGWNGKDMWLSLSGSLNGFDVSAERFWSPHNRAFAESNGGSATVLPSITMKTATGEILMGWLASQTDMLSNDWKIL